MKTYKFMTVLAALFLIMPAFVSCGNDDDDEPAAVESISGSYTGTLGYSVMGYPADNLTGDYTLVIAKDAKEKDEVTVTLPQCSFTYPGSQAGAYTIPALTVTGVDVKVKGNVYTIEKDNFKVSLDGVDYTGSMIGTVAGKDAKVEYTLQPGRMPMDINFTFQGSVK